MHCDICSHLFWISPTVKRKFHIKDGEDLVLVDEQEGFGIDDDVLGDVVTSHPSVSLMVLKEDEEWSGKFLIKCIIIQNCKPLLCLADSGF